MGFRNRVCIAVVEQRHRLNTWSNRNAGTVCGNWKKMIRQCSYNLVWKKGNMMGNLTLRPGLK